MSNWFASDSTKELKRPKMGSIVPKLGPIMGLAMSSTTMGDALFTKTQQRVLGLLYGKPDKSFYTNEIVRLANMGRGTIQRELDRLVSAGLLHVSREGNQRHYQANKECPIYSELLGIVRKTFGVVDIIRAALAPVEEQIELAFIYGSVAKGEDNARSDIDVLIVGDDLVYSEIMTLFAGAEQSLGRPVNPTMYDEEQIKTKLKEKNAFLTRVMEQPKLWIKGKELVSMAVVNII